MAEETFTNDNLFSSNESAVAPANTEATTGDNNGGLDKYEMASGFTPEQIKEYFGNVSEKATFSNPSPLKGIFWGTKLDKEQSTDSKKVYAVDHNKLRLEFSFKDEFDSTSSIFINCVKVPETKIDKETGSEVEDVTGKKRNLRTNNMIKLGLHAYGFTDFDSLAKFAIVYHSDSDNVNQQYRQLINRLLTEGGETKEELLVPIYEQVGFDKRSNQQFHYYTWCRRIKTVARYSKYHTEHGTYPLKPTENAYFNYEEIFRNMAMNNVPEGERYLRGKVLSVFNNTNLNRFEVELEPLDMTPTYAGYRKNDPEHEYSFLVTFSYGKWMGEGQPTQLDKDKRRRQSRRLCDVLGALRYSEVASKVGTIVMFSVNRMKPNANLNIKKTVYYAQIERPLGDQSNDKVKIWGAGSASQQNTTAPNATTQDTGASSDSTDPFAPNDNGADTSTFDETDPFADFD